MENVETNISDRVTGTNGKTESDNSEPIKNEIIDEGKVSLPEEEETTCSSEKDDLNDLSETNENDYDLNDINDCDEINENNDLNELTEPTKVKTLNTAA